MNKLLLGALLMSASASQALEVTDVVARQRWPWNNLVDVTFTVSGAESSETFYKADLSATFPGVSGDRLVAKTLADEPIVKGNGTFRLVWDMGADAPGLVTTNLSVQVAVAPMADSDPMYLVVDLSGGPTATSYPYHYTTTPPDLSKDDCRTKEFWFKRCPAGTFRMGYSAGSQKNTLPPHYVKLTKPFYLAVFETTQDQWYRVTGNWPSYFSNEKCRATRPVESVRLSDIRGYANNGTYWYETHQVGATSFLGLLRARCEALATADLPTEAQWEYACRAGTTTQCYYTDLDVENFWGPACSCGRNTTNAGSDWTQDSPDTVATAKVGTYAANPWGFYDMMGNVAEWCGDYCAWGTGGYSNYWSEERKAKFEAHTIDNPIIDPRTALPEESGTTYGAYTLRGLGLVSRGSWQWQWCTSTARDQMWDGNVADCRYLGVRVCVPTY